MKKREAHMITILSIFSITLILLLLAFQLYNQNDKRASDSQNYDNVSDDMDDVLAVNDFFYRNRENIQNVTAILLKYEGLDGEVVSINLSKSELLTNSSQKSFYYSLQEGTLIGDLYNDRFNKIVYGSNLIDILSDLRISEDFSEIVINYEKSSIVISFCVNNEKIKNICKKNNGSGADILYYVGKKEAEDYGYHLITDDYYSYIKPRPE